MMLYGGIISEVNILRLTGVFCPSEHDLTINALFFVKHDFILP
jgi:hypothetical protein